MDTCKETETGIPVSHGPPFNAPHFIDGEIMAVENCDGKVQFFVENPEEPGHLDTVFVSCTDAMEILSHDAAGIEPGGVVDTACSLGATITKIH